MYKEYLNKKVVVRSYDAGVYFGTLTSAEGEQVKLTNVRNIWNWNGAMSISDIATKGIESGNVTVSVDSMVINRVCQVIPLTEKATKNLEGQPVWTYKD